MPQEHPGPDQIRIAWPETWRIIASRFPPIQLFERLSDNPDAWEALAALEQATNPRARDDVGDIRLVPADRRVAGAGATWVMAPFTHVNPKGSRFSNGTFGVYYAARDLITAIRETIFHFEKFALDSNDPPRREDMRVLLGEVANTFDDLDSVPHSKELLNPNSYAVSQPFGDERRTGGSNGISYPSVRHDGGRCIAAFWPNVVGIPIQERHLQYDWDGKRVARYFDFGLEEWVNL
jgi:RES domain-containing protein